MKKAIYSIFSILLISLLLIACNDDTTDTETKNAGFLDYQYDYVLVKDTVSTAKQSYRRVNLSNAAFALYAANTLPDSLTEKGLRKMELFLYSDNYNLDKTASDQPLGASMVQITLVDSLAFDSNSNRVLPYSYTIQNEAYLLPRKKPVCLGLSVNMDLMVDTATQQLDYRYKFVGEPTRTVRVMSLGNDLYQIIATGLANTKIYNLYYYGKIKKHSDIVNQ